MRTHRDLYLFISALAKRNAASERDLETYLAALWQLALPHRDVTAFTLDGFAALLEEAYSAPAPADVPAPVAYDATAPSFTRWERLVLAQARDLREMRAAKILDDPQRCLGVKAPSGAPWFNFIPRSFLGCGAAGTFDGWQDSDAAGDDGAAALVDWDTFAAFLGDGETYE